MSEENGPPPGGAITVRLHRESACSRFVLEIEGVDRPVQRARIARNLLSALVLWPGLDDETLDATPADVVIAGASSDGTDVVVSTSGAGPVMATVFISAALGALAEGQFDGSGRSTPTVASEVPATGDGSAAPPPSGVTFTPAELAPSELSPSQP